MTLSVSPFDKAKEWGRTQLQKKLDITDTQEWTTFSMLWDYCFTRSQQLCRPVCGNIAFLKITLFLDLCFLRRNVVDPTSKSLIHIGARIQNSIQGACSPLSLSSHKSYLPQPKPHSHKLALLKNSPASNSQSTHTATCGFANSIDTPLAPSFEDWKTNKTNTIMHP